jgi:hypothetical protein
MNDRKCLQCQDQLSGRANQKFCTSQCRNAYKNIHSIKPNLIRTINRILRKNYSILTALYTAGKTTATLEDLQKQGYCFDYFTFTNTTHNSRTNYFCYDQGFREQDANKLVLFRHDLTNHLYSPLYQSFVV